ncbi:MAG: OmpA family protein [bacterium]
MKKTNLLIFIIVAGLFASCATAAPKELVSARNAYDHAKNSIAANISPAELHVAKTALNEAEKSFENDPKSITTKDLSYIAQRKSEIAEATASIILEKKKQELAKSDFLNIQSIVISRNKKDLDATLSALAASEFRTEITQRNLSQSESALATSELDAIIAKGNLNEKEIALAKSEHDANIAKKNLSQSETALAKSEHGAKMTRQQLKTEKEARMAAEERASEALDALAKLAAVKNEPRGMVITISGGVLFASNQTTLLASAKSKLNEIITVLLTTKEKHLLIEGHTDSQGSKSYNMDLSQRRADAVRNYLMEKGYEGDLIVANGLGEAHPVGNNSSPEGRANNRRVEIVVEKELQAIK